ncbi:MAG: hypothetical protein KAX38_04670, partial [Candidatus Krumholzibacteria bacterium]|nr:hypothetical protein [Candidatus Krumholzibacteria bacterium]
GQWNWFWITFLVQIVAYPITFVLPAYILLPVVYGIHQYQMAGELNELLAEEQAKQPDEDEYESAIESTDVD